MHDLPPDKAKQVRFWLVKERIFTSYDVEIEDIDVIVISFHPLTKKFALIFLGLLFEIGHVLAVSKVMYSLENSQNSIRTSTGLAQIFSNLIKWF